MATQKSSLANFGKSLVNLIGTYKDTQRRGNFNAAFMAQRDQMQNDEALRLQEEERRRTQGIVQGGLDTGISAANATMGMFGSPGVLESRQALPVAPGPLPEVPPPDALAIMASMYQQDPNWASNPAFASGVQGAKAMAPKYDQENPAMSTFKYGVGGERTQLSQGQPQDASQTYRSPFKRALIKNGQPVYEKRDGVTQQVYELIDPVSKQQVGLDYEKIDDTTGRSPASQTVLNTIIGRYKSDAQTKKQENVINAASNIRELLAANNPVADMSIPTYMARLSGEVGALSEADKAPFGGEQSIAQKIEQYTSKAVSGELTSENRRWISQLADVLEKNSKKNRARTARDYSKTYGGANKINPSELYDLLNDDPENPFDEAIPSDSSGGIKFDMNDFNNWKKKRSGQ